MQMLKSKTLAIMFALFLSASMAASTLLIPDVNAHSPPWNIPTYAYINAAPNPIGVGQTVSIFMWLDPVFGSAGTATVGSSAALLSNNYRFHNFRLAITPPNGTATTVTFDVVTDTTSSQAYRYTPTSLGTYTLNFTFPGQGYAQYAGQYNPTSTLVNDTYLPSSAVTTFTVQSTPIPVSAGAPLPTNYWQEPIYGENSNWWPISSNWLGVGAGLFGAPIPPPSGYTSTQLYHGDAVGPMTSHIMWTTPTQNGGIVGGNMFPDAPGVAYFEGSSYAPRFQNPIIMNGYLYYTQVASFTGSPLLGGTATGPTICVNLRTGQQLWSNKNIPQLQFGYIYNVYDPDQHGVYPPVLVATTGGFNLFAPELSKPMTWMLYDGFTGDPLFNVTNVPSGTAVMGPGGEQLQYVFNNVGTPSSPKWYMAEWNSSRLWLYDINPYSGSGSVSPSIMNATGHLFVGGSLGSVLPIPITGEIGTFPNGTNVVVPYGSTLIVDGDVSIAAGAAISQFNSPTTYDWNISMPWMNQLAQAFPFNPITVAAADYGDMLLCYSGSLPTGFAATNGGVPQLPYTMFAVNLNASKGAIGQVLWQKTYNPPSGNITVTFGGADWQTRTFCLGYTETIQWVGYSLKDGTQIWGPTTPETAFDYYGTPGTPVMQAFLAYGTLYSSSFGGICYARDDVTGQLKFTYGNGPPGSDNSTFAGFNGPYGVYPTFIQSIANGVVYLSTDEHTVTNPIYIGATIAAINATTGKLIWQLSGYPSEWASTGSAFAVADGYLTFFNGYDGQIYSVGKGPSATTITAPNIGVTTATPITITGTVMDISAGTQQAAPKANFPFGVPCASDAGMKAWMGYVYQQQPEPTNFTGVPVQIAVLDSNGNHRSIGTVLTDESGTYSLTWTPDITGNYTIYASFAGTNGYFPSSAAAHIYAGSPPATPAPTASPVSLASTQSYIVGIGIAVIIVIIIGIAVLALLIQRKRP